MMTIMPPFLYRNKCPKLKFNKSKGAIIKKTIEIKNLMIFPIVLKIRTSHQRIIELSKYNLKINTKLAEKIDVIIHLNLLRNKSRTKNDNMHIFFESDALEFKYSIVINS